MKILITGTTGLAASLAHELNSHDVFCAGRSNGYDLNNIHSWGYNFFNYDICINNAWSKFAQVDLLELFYSVWKNDTKKQIINIGSNIVDYGRTEINKAHEYLPYTLHKQALQSAFNKMVKQAVCDIKLINPGPVDTAMIAHLQTEKMPPNELAKKIIKIMQDPWIKRIDIWQ